MDALNEKKDNSTKINTIIAVAVLAVAVVVGGIVLAKNISHTKAATQVQVSEKDSLAADSGKAAEQSHEISRQVITGADATEQAQVKEADAIEVIRGYSNEQLGINKEEYTFMVAQQAYVIDGEKFVQVIAAEKTENKDGTFSITPHGEYYISFDGKTVLKANPEAPGEYSKL